VAQRATEGSIQGERGVETCRARPGGSRMRANNCENDGAAQTARTEHELTVKIELPAATGPQCEASTLTEYSQRDTAALVMGTVSISSCPAGSTGSFTLVARVKDAAGELKPLEFKETWQHDDAQDHVFDGAYPIGDDVELVSVRVRNLTCSCAQPAPAEPALLDAAPAPPAAPLEPL
jgi:hypothetical protein